MIAWLKNRSESWWNATLNTNLGLFLNYTVNAAICIPMAIWWEMNDIWGGAWSVSAIHSAIFYVISYVRGYGVHRGTTWWFRKEKNND